MRKTAFRILLDRDRSPEFNMAADRYAVELADETNTIVLRFYTWDAPTVTLGYMQVPENDLDMAALSAYGGKWVRRATGGRAVLHEGDLTYSIAFGASHSFLGLSVAETYSKISKCLIRGLGKCGIHCDTHDSDLDTTAARREKKLPCFLAPNRNEIMVNGRKLIGSAQKRTIRGVVQHGSIPIDGLFRNLPNFLAVSPSRREEQIALLRRKCTCLRENGVEFSIWEIAERLSEGFVEELELPRFDRPWSEMEENGISELALREKRSE